MLMKSKTDTQSDGRAMVEAHIEAVNGPLLVLQQLLHSALDDIISQIYTSRYPGSNLWH